MLLDRQILTLDGIATELPYYQYMYVDVWSEAGLLQGVGQVESTLCWQECFAWELWILKCWAQLEEYTNKRTDREEGEVGR